MSEKTGHTVKIKYDFPEHLCCEVYVPNLEDWFRVTPNEFRSWVGQRRILRLKGKVGDGKLIRIMSHMKDQHTYLVQIKKLVQINLN